jgi:hypothetical protein
MPDFAGTTPEPCDRTSGWKSRSMVDRYAKFATETLDPLVEVNSSGNSGLASAQPSFTG